MALWDVQVPPGEAVSFIPTPETGKLRVSKATLVPGEANGDSCLSCKVGNSEPIILCSLKSGLAESANLDLFYDKYTEFIVEGVAAVKLSGYYLPVYDSEEDDSDKAEDEEVDSDDNAAAAHDDDDDDDDDDDVDDDGEVMFASPWFMRVPPGVEVSFIPTPEMTKVIAVQAVMEGGGIGQRSILSCKVEDGEPIMLCSLSNGSQPDSQECTILDLHVDRYTKFRVEGGAAVCLYGFSLGVTELDSENGSSDEDDEEEEEEVDSDDDDDVADLEDLNEEEAHLQFPSIRLALRHGHEGAMRQHFEQLRDVKFPVYLRVLRAFAEHCVEEDDAPALAFAFALNPGLPAPELVIKAALFGRVDCLRLLLRYRAPWHPANLTHVAWGNRLDSLEVLLDLRPGLPWCPLVPTIAAFAGNVRFLQRIFAAGCPVWTSADDHTEDGMPENWTLVVSPNVEVSGPVLLYAAQKGAPLTPRMKETLRDVRRRALALASCFHKAARPKQPARPRGGAGEDAREWDAMRKVPVKVVQRIATLAKISIIATDLVK